MSLRKAINNMCKTCIYDGNSGGGTWRQQVEACTAPNCPLFPYRPKSAPKKTTADNAREALAKASELGVE